MIVVLRPVLPPPIQPFSTTAMLRQAVLGREVVGRAEPMAAAADDDRVVGRLRLGLAPLLPPVRVAGEARASRSEKPENCRFMRDAQARRSLFSGS